jgi:DNA-binding CsgD family transcriptional regulator
MLKGGSYIVDDARPVFVAGGDGNIITQNKPARRLLGPGTGKYCWEVVRGMDGASKLPCRRGCVLELIASGMDSSQHAEFKLGGECHTLSCTPVNGAVVCMLSSTSDQAGKLLEPLSPREREILLLLADGETTASAADQLGVCESTVRTHVERMRSKLSVPTRAAVVAEGFRLGYLD